MNIKTVVKENIQEIIVEKDGIEKTIYSLPRASKNNFCKYIEDMNYIIIYNDRRDQEGYHYIDVRCVYDTNTDEILNLSPTTYYRLTYMYAKKTSFSLETIMSYLLNIVTFDNKKVKQFYEYMSSYNPLITKEQIRKEVIRQYPIIEKYLSPLIYIFNKKQLENKLRGSFLQLNAIKQDIRELDHLEKQKKEQLEKRLIYKK